MTSKKNPLEGLSSSEILARKTELEKELVKY